MSYEGLLTNRCDIYHLKERDGGGGWGVPATDDQKEHYYSDVPDVTNAKCYFTENNQSIIQMDPNNMIIQSYNVHFLKSEDVRINSKVVWDGVSFKSQKPKNIRNHHQEVTVLRSDNL